MYYFDADKLIKVKETSLSTDMRQKCIYIMHVDKMCLDYRYELYCARTDRVHKKSFQGILAMLTISTDG